MIYTYKSRFLNRFISWGILIEFSKNIFYSKNLNGLNQYLDYHPYFLAEYISFLRELQLSSKDQIKKIYNEAYNCYNKFNNFNNDIKKLYNEQIIFLKIILELLII